MVELLTQVKFVLKVLVVAITPLERLRRRTVLVKLIPRDEAVSLTRLPLEVYCVAYLATDYAGLARGAFFRTILTLKACLRV